MTTKEIATMTASEDTVVVDTEVKTRWKLREILPTQGILNSFMPGIALISSLAHGAPENAFSWIFVVGGSAILAPMGYQLNRLISDGCQTKKLYKFLSENGLHFEGEEIMKAIDGTKKSGRVLLSSFHIRESSEVVIGHLKSENPVPAEHSSHKVKQYLVRAGGKFFIEQEVTPNQETIWDISADALVEVYGVQEKTDSMKEVTA